MILLLHTVPWGDFEYVGRKFLTSTKARFARRAAAHRGQLLMVSEHALRIVAMRNSL